MTRTILIAAAVAGALALAGCASSGTTSTPAVSTSSAALANTNWTLTSYPADGTGAAVPVPAAVTITANFTADRIGGSSGCNTYSGPYSTTGSTITIGPTSTTLIACESLAIESAYTKALDAATKYAVAGNRLTLTTTAGAKLSFVTATAVELVGPTWVATGINNGKGGVQSLVAGTTATAVFDTHDTVSGNATCNTYSGSYTLSGASLTIGPLRTTLKACADAGASAQESAYTAALERVAKYAITDGRLELRDAKGALQVSYTLGPK